MRIHPLHHRKREILHRDDIPRRGEKVLLCHMCQWNVYAVGGMTERLIMLLERAAKKAHACKIWLDRERNGTLTFLPNVNWSETHGLEFKNWKIEGRQWVRK